MDAERMMGKPITFQEVMGLEHAPCRECLGDEGECPHCSGIGHCPDDSGSCQCWVDAAYALACCWVDAAYALACSGELWDG